MDETSRYIYRTVRENFDKIAYVLTRDTGIVIGGELAREMLSDYRAYEGWLFKIASVDNIPWAFAYATLSKKLIGCRIKKDSKLYDDLKKVSEITFGKTKYSKDVVFVNGKAGKTPLNFHFSFSASGTSESNFYEKLTLCVVINSKSPDMQGNVACKHNIKTSPDYWYNLLNYSDWQKQEKLLELSYEMLPEI